MEALDRVQVACKRLHVQSLTVVFVCTRFFDFLATDNAIRDISHTARGLQDIYQSDQ